MRKILPFICFIGLLLLVGLELIQYSVQPELPTKARVIHHTIPVRYEDKTLLLQDFQKDLISLDETIQILLLYSNDGIFVPFFDADTYSDQYYIHKKTYTERKAK